MKPIREHLRKHEREGNNEKDTGILERDKRVLEASFPVVIFLIVID
jgi:hypothetical protein